ncbi:hypothetical protein LR48_Vigan03g088500 [Vigna angularis]|uniref:Uncharacterized protein n=1 Tax=Phaseolus angularis TaxID=3914 RepID=A0A0L9U3V8_PHAAN|nr:hypothetical protein LR48_Vigan03g088500 [Vigna angularis]
MALSGKYRSAVSAIFQFDAQLHFCPSAVTTRPQEHRSMVSSAERLKVFTVMKKKTMVNGRGRTWLTMTTKLKRGCVFGYKEWRNRFDDEEELHSGAYSVTREA